MILDAETLELANAIESLLEDRADGDGEIKPELMESVLEIATEPCRDTRRGGRAAARRCAAQVRETAAAQRAGDRLRRHAPVRDVGGPAHRRAARATAT